MENKENNSGNNPSGTSADTGETTNQDGQGGTDTNAFIPRSQYEELQAFATKSRQNEIARTIKLVKKDSEELHQIEDEKLRDSVTKNILNMSYSEAVAVFGKGFSIENSNNNDSGTSDSELAKKIRLMEFKESQRELNYHIDKIRAKYPQISEDAVSKIIEEVGYISKDIGMESRVDRAFAVVKSKSSDAEAYKAISPTTTKSTPQNLGSVDSKTAKLQDELRGLLGFRK